MKKNYWSKASTDKNYIFDCLVSGIINFNKALEIKIVKNKDCLYPIKREPTIFDFTFKYCSNKEHIEQIFSSNKIIKELYDNYTPLFLFEEERETYVKTGVIDTSKITGIGKVTPVLKKLLPRTYSEIKNYKWVLDDVDLTDFNIEHVFVIDIFDSKILETYQEKSNLINKAKIFLDEHDL